MVLICVIVVSAAYSASGAAYQDRDSLLRWHMLHVSQSGVQGDAHLLIGSSGRVVLIDAGPEQNARSALIPALKEHQVNKIDVMMVTHPHFDHYGGLLTLLESGFSIGKIYMYLPTKAVCERESPWGCRWSEIEKIRLLAGKAGVQIFGPKNFSSFSLGDRAVLSSVVAFDASSAPDWTLNDYSWVLALSVHGKRQVLFTADVNVQLGDWLLKNRNWVLRTPMLKAPHHGTEGTAGNDFFEAIQPLDTFVPAPVELWCSERSRRIREVLERLGSRVFVSGAHGTVTVQFSRDKNSSTRVGYRIPGGEILCLGPVYR